MLDSITNDDNNRFPQDASTSQSIGNGNIKLSAFRILCDTPNRRVDSSATQHTTI